jgi:hypothetical protein
MLVRSDQIKSIEDHAIKRCLVGQALERVLSALDLIPCKLAIDHGDINPNSAVPNSHFFDNARVRVAVVFAPKSVPNCSSDVLIPHAQRP